MNLRDLTYLVALADHRHFSHAAAACFVSQPGLSIQIKKLETALGVQLVERHHKSVLLTEIGEKIATEARDILERVEHIENLAKQAQDPLNGTFDLGVLPTLAPYLLPHILPVLSTEVVAKLKIYLAEQQTSQLLLNLQQGKIDAALVSLPLTEKYFDVQPLFDEEILLAVPSHHSLAQKKSLKFSDLKNQTLLLLEEGHCLRDQALSICQKAHAFEEEGFRAASLETLRYMVASNVGITLMPKLACLPNKRICYIPFTHPKPKRSIGLIWRASSAKTILIERLAQRIKQAIKNIN